MKEHFNKLTPGQAEALAILAEECAEVVQAVGKILRHGLDSQHTHVPGLTNVVSLEQELGDAHLAMQICADIGIVRLDKVIERVGNKAVAIVPYLHHVVFSGGKAK